MKRAPNLNPAFKWHAAASHQDVSAFKARQEARRIAVQSKPAPNVAPIHKERKA